MAETQVTGAARVYTVEPGHLVWIDGYGYANNDVPAVVPAHVGIELSYRTDLRVELPTAAAPPKAAAKRGEKE